MPSRAELEKWSSLDHQGLLVPMAFAEMAEKMLAMLDAGEQLLKAYPGRYCSCGKDICLPCTAIREWAAVTEDMKATAEPDHGADSCTEWPEGEA